MYVCMCVVYAEIFEVNSCCNHFLFRSKGNYLDFCDPHYPIRFLPLERLVIWTQSKIEQAFLESDKFGE